MSPESNVTTGLLNKDEVVLKGIVSKFVNEGPTFTPTVSNNLKTTFEILFIDNFTGTIKTSSTDDKFVGAATVGITASVAGKQFQVQTNDNEVNLNGEAGAAVATTGGLKGSYIKFTAVAANLYFVEGLLNSTGSIATPFDTQ